jgi:hypothetical protein
MLYTGQLLKIVLEHFPHLAKHFEGVYPLNKLPFLHWRSRKPLGLIVNTDTADLPGKHWVACLLLPDGRGECFDSFGQIPPPRVQFWMNKHCLRSWTYNRITFQSPLSTLCGAYCIYYLYYRIVHGMTLDDIVRRLKSMPDSDDVVLRFLKKYNC